MSATLDPARLDAFLGRFVQDAGATMHATTVVVGDRLGLYRALDEGPTDSAGLARRTGLDERMLREWLRAQAASGYVDFEAATGRYRLNAEQSFALADPNGLSLPGAFLIAEAVMHDIDRLAEAFRTGRGMGWHEHHHQLFHGTERFFRPTYARHLVEEWIPALTGVRERLLAGGTVADVGCGHGVSTLLMAHAFPRASIRGFDYHEDSVRTARRLAEEAGVGDRVTFEVASAKDFPGTGYDLVAFFDCLHDMGDPAGAARHVHQSLGADGAWMVVEPIAADRDEDNFNPVGRIYYSASTMICTPCSLAQDVGAALGAQAGEARLSEVIRSGGFTRVRRAAETPFNMVLEARH